MLSTIRTFAQSTIARIVNAYNRAMQALRKAVLALLARLAKRTLMNEVETVVLNVSPIAIPTLQILGYYQAYVGLETIAYILSGYFTKAFVAMAWQYAIIALVIAFLCFVVAGYMVSLQEKYAIYRLS